MSKENNSPSSLLTACESRITSDLDDSASIEPRELSLEGEEQQQPKSSPHGGGRGRPSRGRLLFVTGFVLILLAVVLVTVGLVGSSHKNKNSGSSNRNKALEPNPQDDPVVPTGPDAPVPTVPQVSTTMAPTLSPVISDPTHQASNRTEPSQASVTSEPTQAPKTAEPTQAPVTATPNQAPVTSGPTQAPTQAFVEVTMKPSAQEAIDKDPIPEDPVILINAGGPDYQDKQNKYLWQNDERFVTGGETVRSANCESTDFLNTPTGIDKMLFCFVREGMDKYEIPVTNGAYKVILHVADYQKTELRLYDVFMENIRVHREIGDQDSFYTAFTISATTNVQDELLEIDFIFAKNNDTTVLPPLISAIEVYHADPDWLGIHSRTNLTFIPGSLTKEEEGIILSEGLTARLLATTNENVPYYDGSFSSTVFHILPDAGATFPDPRPGNEGGWIYVSNSEAKEEKEGGVGAFTFDRDGRVIDYRMVLTGTQMNCGGGKAPWDAWISCEERDDGRIYQVDPTGERNGTRITMGEIYPGAFESFAYDVRDRSKPRFYATKDSEHGELRRFTPDNPDWNDPWSILLGTGTLDYLYLQPSEETRNRGTYIWSLDKEDGDKSARRHFPNSEGIDVSGNLLFFVSKQDESMIVLDLDAGTYEMQSTRIGLFNGQPDQVYKILNDHPESEHNDMLYFTEEGKYSGVHARNQKGQFYTILESQEHSHETTGLAFSPNGKHLYIAYQEDGLVFDVSRIDGLSFQAKTLNVKYHDHEDR